MRNSLLLDSYPLLVIPELAQAIGLNEAIVLQQVHYWCLHSEKTGNNFRDGYYWVYNSYREWQQQFPWWSERTIKSIFSRLEHNGLLISGNYNKLRMDRTKWYRIDHDILSTIVSNMPLGKNCPMDNADIAQAIPKNTHRKQNGRKVKWNAPPIMDEHSAHTSVPILDSCNAEISSFIDWYFDYFWDMNGYEHPNIKADQKRKVVKTLDDFTTQNGLDIDDLEEMAVAFFNNVENSDHNINHFATPGILENRYYEAVY